MAKQVTLPLPTQLKQLSSAELASLVIELIEDERVAVLLGEEVYRRLTQAALPAPAPAPELAWYRPLQPALPVRPGRPA